MDTISHFLDTHSATTIDAETRAPEQRIFNPTPDYAQLLAKEEEKSEPEENGEKANTTVLTTNSSRVAAGSKADALAVDCRQRCRQTGGRSGGGSGARTKANSPVADVTTCRC